MDLSIDHPLVLPIGLGVVGLNFLCLLFLLLVRPAVRHARSNPAAAREMADAARASLGEFVGTFGLMLGAFLLAAAPALNPAAFPNLLVAAVAQGALLAALAAGPGAASGGHFNPALTLGLAVCGKVPAVRAASYFVAQTLGAVAAAGVVLWAFDPALLRYAVPAAAPDMPVRSVFLLEALATFVFALAVTGAAVSRYPAVTPFAAGAALTGCAVVFGPLSGGVFNPVRYLVPALLCREPGAWLAYALGPLIGGCIAAALSCFFLAETPDAAGEEAEATPEAEEAHARDAA